MTEATTERRQAAVDAWNARVPVGTPVRYWTGAREHFGDAPPDEGKTSHTSSEAWLLGGHTPVVRVYGESACIALTHVQPTTEEGNR